MSRKANPAVIGLFVVAAIAILFGAILILGSGKIMKDSEPHVLYFEGNLSGLDVGAPVEYRGVRVGAVTNIRLDYETETGEMLIPVFIELRRDRIRYIGEPSLAKGAAFHIERGLRAQLQTQSMITGKLKIMLVMATNTVPRFVGASDSVPEFPTIPGTLDDLAKRFLDLPFEEIVLDLKVTSEALAHLAESGEISAMIQDMRDGTKAFSGIATSEGVQDVVKNLQTGTEAFADIAESGEIQTILGELRNALEGISNMTNSSELKEAIHSLNETLLESQKLVATFRRTSEPMQLQIQLAIDEVTDAARAARTLLDYLGRHPEALIKGKEGQ